MNKYLQILIGITTVVWLLLGIGLIIGGYLLIALPTILGINFSNLPPSLEKAPVLLAIKNAVYIDCLEKQLGVEETDKILSWEDISSASAGKIRSCNY